jgi:hypothetical protein
MWSRKKPKKILKDKELEKNITYTKCRKTKVIPVIMTTSTISKSFTFTVPDLHICKGRYQATSENNHTWICAHISELTIVKVQNVYQGK